MTDKPELTFEQFATMCEDAGIQAKPEELEQDYRTGAVLADVVDEVMEEMEANPPLDTVDDGFGEIEDIMADLRAEVLGGKDPAVMRQFAIELGALSIRFASDLCHDEAGLS